MADLRDDLNAPLPPGVLSDLGGWTLYQNYRSFTWPWLLRRGALFWPLAILAGFAYAAWHSSGMGAWTDWPGLAARSALASLIAVSTGPALATGVRHLKTPRAIERALIVLAIVGGFWIGAEALAWASRHHDHLMQAYAGRSMEVGVVGRALSRFFRASVDTSIFALIVAGGGLSVLYYLGEQRRVAAWAARQNLMTLRAERDASDIRLAVLQAQVEPHFLFNTLASVRSLIKTEPRRAARTIDALAAYLRASLPRLRSDALEEATLDRQIDLCERYLDVMRERMAGRLSVHIEADAEARQAPFPPLILITLVENAITHGIEPKPGPGNIWVRATQDDGVLTVLVEDDGAGLGPSLGQGVGLANVRAQLQSRFRDEATLEVAARSGGGVRASVCVPVGRE